MRFMTLRRTHGTAIRPVIQALGRLYCLAAIRILAQEVPICRIWIVNTARPVHVMVAVYVGCLVDVVTWHIGATIVPAGV